MADTILYIPDKSSKALVPIKLHDNGDGTYSLAGGAATALIVTDLLADSVAFNGASIALIKTQTDKMTAVKAKTDLIPAAPAAVGDLISGAAVDFGAAAKTSLQAAAAAALAAAVNKRQIGVRQVFSKSITSAADAGDVTVGTITTQGCLITRIIIRAEGVNTDMLTCPVFGGASKVVAIIPIGTAILASLDAADKQVSVSGAWALAATKTLVMTLAGGGSTPVALTVIVEYEAVADGGYIV